MKCFFQSIAFMCLGISSFILFGIGVTHFINLIIKILKMDNGFYILLGSLISIGFLSLFISKFVQGDCPKHIHRGRGPGI